MLLVDVIIHKIKVEEGEAIRIETHSMRLYNCST
jgi:hypothetical protein